LDTAGDFCVDALQQILHIAELLGQFAYAGLNILHIVRNALGLLGHGIDP
jgi:hypothetical protein